MRRFLNGNSGLAKTYWIGVFLIGGLVANGVTHLIVLGYLYVPPHLYARLVFVHALAQGAFTLWMLLMVRAMWRAARDRRRPGVWGWTGLGLTVLGAAQTAIFAVNMAFPNMPIPGIMIRLEIANLNKALPAQTEPGVYLLRADFHDATLTFHYSIADPFEGGDPTRITGMDVWNDIVFQDACRDMVGFFRGGLDDFVLQYRFSDTQLEATMGHEDCLEWYSWQRARR